MVGNPSLAKGRRRIAILQKKIRSFKRRRIDCRKLHEYEAELRSKFNVVLN